MSEFKFACPVCGQHMMCDSSQGGSVMECPTCFQKITAPQAPADNAKFILTGTKVTEKKITTRVLDGAASPTATQRNFPVAVLIGVVVVVLAAGSVAFAFRAKIFGPATATPVKVAAATNSTPPPKPAPVAPHASDTNWMLTLEGVEIPNSPVVGRIHGQDFIAERANFQNGTLTVRAGTRGAVDFGMQINFSGAQPEALAGQTINVSTNADKAAQVTLHWKDDGGAQKENFNVGYALRLEFGALANNRLPGRIYLCTPDPEKSYLLGKFNAAIARPRPKPATPPNN
jgi:hypothetical protein